MAWTILTGDNRETLKTIADDTIDAIVTDPPYGIDFLGKAWDANTGALETYQECLRVLKPGGHILAFSAARTYHHLAVTLEQAGFEIRDQIMWIYSSGFPKSQDVGRSIQRSLGVKDHYTIDEWEQKQGYNVNHPGDTMGFGNPDKLDGHKDSGLSGKVVKVTDPEAREWEGWGTALKPAHEPICLARKPLKLSIARNCQEWGVGALNIHATKVNDRFPSNVIGEIPDYQKYFYCPKVSRKERHIGYIDLDTSTNRDLLLLVGGKYVAEDGTLIDAETSGSCPGKMVWLPNKGKILAHGLKHEVEIILRAQGREDEIPKSQGNNHPTVKPVELMKYLIQLITPAGGTVLDPFTGSGSTGMAAVELGHTFIGCELDPAYVDIANRRIQAWLDLHTNPDFERLFIEE